MKTAVTIILSIVLFSIITIAANTASVNVVNDCYIKILSTATLEYNFNNISANTLILDISSFRYDLLENNYIVVTLGYPPLNLYGFAIINENNTTYFYSIRGDQNHWHRIVNNISGNIIIRIEAYNKSLRYEMLSKGILIDSYKTNTSLNSIELRNLGITIASPYESKSSWLMFKELVLTADNHIIINLLPNNNTLTEIKENNLLYPNENNVEIVCIKPITVTRTITYNHTITVTASPITTTSIIKVSETYTTIIYSTLTTSITETASSVITESKTITATETVTSTYTTTLTEEKATIPVEFYVILVVVLLVIILIVFLLRRK